MGGGSSVFCCRSSTLNEIIELGLGKVAFRLCTPWMHNQRELVTDAVLNGYDVIPLTSLFDLHSVFTLSAR